MLYNLTSGMIDDVESVSRRLGRDLKRGGGRGLENGNNNGVGNVYGMENGLYNIQCK